jgi:hypothetical protein
MAGSTGVGHRTHIDGGPGELFRELCGILLRAYVRSVTVGAIMLGDGFLDQPGDFWIKSHF